VWNGKPGAVISLSIGAKGGFGANHRLPQSLVFLSHHEIMIPLLAAWLVELSPITRKDV
jgi:NAD(P)H-dependent FMN reductase